MTSEEIKKAFNICCNSTRGCTGCPILKLEEQNGLECKYNLFINAISLITEREKEIEKITEEYKMLANQYKNLEIKYSNLSDNYKLCRDANETLKQNVVTIRKETAEEILNRINEYNLNYNWDLKEEFKKLCKDYDVEVEDDKTRTD